MKTKITTTEDASFRQFQRHYLLVYLFATAGDWLQGPHVYALYDYYGMTKHQIEILFIAGFGSSFLFGTFIASIADKYGRRTICLLYTILYAIACVTKHFADFWILMIGRIFGGIATSILYSGFESWLVCEHNKRGFNEDLLQTIFSHATLGNSIVAVLSGVLAQCVADGFGYVAPFDLSIIALIVTGICAIVTWTENYGAEKVAMRQQYLNAYNAMKNDSKVVCLGLIQSLFEGAMYVFVLEWTPSLTDANVPHVIPHGIIFASFMIAVMIGSSMFKLLTKYQRPESFMRFVLALSALCLGTECIWPNNVIIVFVAFILFEICVGIFWPAMGFMRGIYIPEATRTTMMNFCRVPLNGLVIIILLQNLSRQTIFYCCVIFLTLATVVQQHLHRYSLLMQ